MSDLEWWEVRASEAQRRDALWGIDWPGHPDAAVKGATEESLRDWPDQWSLLRVEEDPDACYSYDDLALMRHSGGRYVLVRTTGCSCPSPTETWGVVAEGSWADCVAHIEAERRSWGSDEWGDRSGPYPGMDRWMRENAPGLPWT